MANGEFWRESKNACPAPPSHPPLQQPTSPWPQEHGGHGDINFTYEKSIFGKSPRGTDLLSPLRLYQQHNDLFERTGEGATQSKTPKKGSSVQFSSVPISSAPKKQKKQQTKP